jgi:hypothetical protein
MGNGATTELLKLTLDAIDKGQFWQVLTLLGVVSIPSILVTGMALWNRWKIGKLYERMCNDKDREVDRLAKRIKELENHLLKTKR